MFRRMRLRLLLALVCLAAAAATAQVKPSPYEKTVSAYEAADRSNSPPKNALLFAGSSSISMWNTLARDFAEYRVINRGISGSHVADAVKFLDRITVPYAPCFIVFYAGVNDLHDGKTPAAVLADFQTFVNALHRRLPQTRVAFIAAGLNPARWAEVDRVRELNQLVRDFTRTDPRLSFIDVVPLMLGPDGLPRPDIFLNDKLHMNAAGYSLWTGLVREHLKKHGADCALKERSP